MLKHRPHRLCEPDDVYISFMWQVFLLHNLDLVSSVKMPLTRLTLGLTSIVYSRIILPRHMYWHWPLRVG